VPPAIEPRPTRPRERPACSARARTRLNDERSRERR
jgi:hypothetical protein